ncbi:MAG: DUF4956 domain-containing protein [Clostridia bacterium]|nr:DUF4956 domain-containing protein [Clostridia bacterium]MBR6754685.1 DUF4956 domain-containing protein [Clostridia bacterium]
MSALFESVLKDGFSVEAYLICIACALVCGIIAAISASIRSMPSKSFIISLILLPMIVSTVITMVNGNVGTGIAVMGAFSLVRFRSVPGKAKDIVSIFLSMTAGLACAGGYVAIAILFSLIVGAVLFALSFIPLGCDEMMSLNITVPESLNFTDAFSDLFKKYTKSHKLVKTKTSNMGSLYKLSYKIKPKDRTLLKEFIDELRCRNGNLEISIFESAEEGESL